MARIAQLEQYNAHAAWSTYNANVNRLAALQTTLNTLQNAREVSAVRYCTQAIYTELRQKYNDLNRRIGSLCAENKEIERENAIHATYAVLCPPIDARLRMRSIYLEAITSVGLRNTIVTAGMSSIMEIVNSITSVCGFKVEMMMGDEITFNIVGSVPTNNGDDVDQKRIPVTMASGMQKFVISLAMRLAICTVLPTPTFMFIDEGFDVVDSDNIMALKSVLHELATSCSFIFIVSHKEMLQNALVHPLSIKAYPTYSHLSNKTEVKTNICSCGMLLSKIKNMERHLVSKKHLLTSA
jgi:DNA repair exonuclease SbcCD ATPase subunit